jgi:thiol-disulfide isomerase/thioredoxin
MAIDCREAVRVLSLLYCLAIARSLGGADEPSPAAALLDAALKLETAQRYDEALAKLRDAAALKPEPPLAAEIAFRTGEVLFRKGRDAFQGKMPSSEPAATVREAIRSFQELLERYPKTEKASSAGFLLGTSYLLIDDTEHALAAYRRVYEGYPGSKDQPIALIRMGICQAGLEDPKEARASFERFLKEFPQEKLEGAKVVKCIQELTLFGQVAPPLLPSKWMTGAVDREGIKGFEGQLVIVVFFAPWCPNCRSELPHLRALMAKWMPRNAVFIGVANPNDPQNKVSVEAYVRSNGLEFLDVALDSTARSASSYRVTGFPAAALIDQKGIVRWRGHLAFFPNALAEKALSEGAKR